MPSSPRFEKAMSLFDAYNARDPIQEVTADGPMSKELLYAQRMSERLSQFAPGTPEYVQMAARCQHIGRWEIPRNSYPMDKKGYLRWRNTLKDHHARIAEEILTECAYEAAIIDQVKFLVLKKELHKNADTQLLEDVICLVFVEYYLEEFASKHDDEKVVDILRKTMKKMSARGIDEVGNILVSPKIKGLIQRAAGG